MTHTQADFDVFFLQKLNIPILCKICSTDRHKKSCFCVFLIIHNDFQRAGRVFKLMQNHTHHKTTPNTASERPTRLTVSVTLEDAWPS